MCHKLVLFTKLRRVMDFKERAKLGGQERWHPKIPKATHTGILNIGGKEIVCDVLQDGRRVLRQKTFAKAIGKGKPSGEGVRRGLMHKIPIFVCANNLAPYLEEDFLRRAQEIYYKTSEGRKVIGYDATVLPEACKIYVKAERDNVLMKQQIEIAKVCQIMLYGLATVGITALIDDCTGYVEQRNRQELQQILDKYISEELRSWTRKFPDEFFKQTYRIHGWEYPKIGNHPQYLGKFINKYIYEKLPSGVLEELQNKNPINEKGARRFRHHQFLSEEIGDDNLKKQLVQIITVMKLSNNVDEFKSLVERL